MNIEDLLSSYQMLPEYSGTALTDLNQTSLFGDRPINIAATRGSMDELETLFRAGASINDGGEHGYSPLHNAVEQGHIGVVEWLLKNGSDISKKDDSGQTPLDLARLLGEVEIVAMIERVTT
ncbi:ankyrin repeat protein [Rhodanobacter sp. K2T2]|uniref:ankyrin repeat domain-containing protein n=1 Tax=Rhodanobacter sp. K2T2 TaxID=2723085 RepID=UPI0015C9CF35|nr:ankyrin repeat domain-containing protein [Rhodanobacter sp. K2T2]NYE28232.1 ankyrin repeat protein [Rhodanobacter sp. K2T2]